MSGETQTPRRSNEAPPYRRAQVLARLHNYPLGFVQVRYDGLGEELGEHSAQFLTDVRTAALSTFGDEINAHLAEDGLPPVETAFELGERGVHRCRLAPGLPDPPPLMSVVIASLRNPGSLLDCVDNLLASSYPNFEVVVVNNAPEGGELPERFAQRFAGADRVRLLHQPLLGLSRARNLGLTAANGEIVVFTDDDVNVDRDWLSHLASGFQADKNVACVTGAILPAELETPAQGWLEQYGGFNKGFVREVYNNTDRARPEPLYPFDSGRFGSGASIAFRTDVLRAMRGFDEVLGAGTPTRGGEDLDLLCRTITDGHTLVYEPAALLWHLHRRPYRALRRQMYSYGMGLSATVTKWLLDKGTSRQVLSRLPAGVGRVLRPDSTKNAAKTPDYPAELNRLEVLGLLVGPVAYLRSRSQDRRLHHSDNT